MLRVLLIEDDEVVKKAWELNLKSLYKEVKITYIPSIDHLKFDKSDLEKLEQDFDIIISDIFLSGDKTGIDFLSRISKTIQNKTIVSSSIAEDHFYNLCVEKNVSCFFIKKPIFKNKIKVIFDKIVKKDLLIETEKKDQNFSIEKDKKSDIKENKIIVLVTGCSSGIGQALAMKLASDDVYSQKYHVVVTAREKSIASVKNKFNSFSNISILPLDLTKPDEVKNTILIVLEKFGHIDVLVNNAGICYRTVIEHMDIDSELNQLRTNYLGPMTLIRSVIPIMRERGFGKIINVSSVSGIMGMPTMGSYTASKHALEGASESLWHELLDLGIRVTVIRPGFINSDGYTHIASTEKAILSTKLEGPWSFLYGFMDPFVKRLMKFSFETPEIVADRIIKVMEKKNPPLWCNVTKDAFLFSFLKQVIPPFLFYRFINLLFILNIKITTFFTKNKV